MAERTISDLQVYQQLIATADALARYLDRHPEFEPGKTGQRRFLTTGKPGAQHSLVETFWGGPLSFEPA